MDPKLKKSAQQWGDLIRTYGIENYKGTYPSIMIWHGSKDQLVDDDNQNELIKQWTNIHGIDIEPDNKVHQLTKDHDRHTYKEYHKDGHPVVVSVLIEGLRHGLSINPGNNHDQGGVERTNSLKGGYSFDYMLHSTYYIARFWGLIND